MCTKQTANIVITQKGNYFEWPSFGKLLLLIVTITGEPISASNYRWQQRVTSGESPER